MSELEYNIAMLTEHKLHWCRLLKEKICNEKEGKDTIEALNTAIASLEAWEKVKAEIKDIKDLYDLGKEELSTKMFIEGVETVERIIDKYRQEVST